ncbi:MAG TPA: PAS domain S-box protein [Nostocaceae cyanobacterium]|nr:PAS domain S-box protein [Nostocaceae cyanobacterium]
MFSFKQMRLENLWKLIAYLGVINIASLFSILVGVIVLLGWFSGIESLRTLYVGNAAITLNAAVCFILSGLSLGLFKISKRRQNNTRKLQLYQLICLYCSRALALVVALFGLLTIIEYVGDINLGIDQVLSSRPSSVSVVYSERIKINAALNFLLIGIALELLGKPKPLYRYWYAQILAIGAGLISLQALVWSAYNVKFFYKLWPALTLMTLPAAFTFLLLCAGILWVNPHQGIMRLVTSNTYTSLLSRRFLLASIMIPLSVGWLIVKGQEAQLYDAAFGMSLFVIILIVAMGIVVWQNAVIVERLSRQRDRAHADLKKYQEKLHSLFNSNIIGILFSDIYGGIEQANEEFLRLIGYTKDDILSGKLDWKNLTPPEYSYLDEKGIAQAKSSLNAACAPYQKEYIRKDGSRVPILIGYVLVGEKKEECVCFVLDLSETKKAEAEQQKLVAIIENSSDFIGFASFAGQTLYLNQAGLKLIGLDSLDHSRQKQVSEYLFPEDQKYFQEYILPTVLCQGHWRGEFRFRHLQTGASIPVDYYVFLIKDKNTNLPIALATITRDISEKKQKEEEILQLNKDLQRRVDELQTLLDVLPVGIGIAEDPECQKIRVNPAFAKQLNISPNINASLSAANEEKPTNFKVYRHGRELAPEELPMQYAAVHGVEVLDFEVDVVHDNGTVVNLLEYVAPLFDEEGKTRGCVGAFLDITERKQTEELQHNHHKWLEDVLNLMPIPLLFIESETANVIFTNQAADELAGGKFPRCKSSYYYTNSSGDRLSEAEMPEQRVANGERLAGLELDLHTSTGMRSLLIFADILPAMHGYPATCLMSCQDITNLKQVEKDLSLGYNKLQLLFNTANNLLSPQQPKDLINQVFQTLAAQVGLDLYFNYVVEHNNYLRLVSYTGISEELAQSIELLEFEQAICGIVAKEKRFMVLENLQISTEPKTEILRLNQIQAFYSYPLMSQGQLLGTLSFGSRSQNYFTENQLAMMQAVCDQFALAMERNSLIASLQQQTDQLKEANRMKDEFLAVLSHELRSPLNAILGWAQLLRARKFNEAQIAQALETIERNARAQTQLVEDLLDISRIIRGKLQLNVHTCDLAPIIEAAIETVNLAAEAKKIDLSFVISPQNLDFHPHFLVSGDPERIQQIIWNLLANAIKFTPIGGNVTITLSKIVIHHPEQENKQLKISNYAQIEVKDTGIGINPEFLPYVFDRFRQADSSSTRSHGGLGVGLSLVRHLVELHGGIVQVSSPGQNQGAIFTVKLPLIAKNPERLDITAHTSDINLSAFSICLAGVRVLVVDDESDSREFVTTVLEQCQAQVQAVCSASEALELLQVWKPDVLVSDIGMPQEDGYSLIRKVRSQPPEQGGKIPAAALTAYARAEDRMRAIQEGYQLHLPKPIEPAELATVVASLVKRNY